jgi:hypothetical protein
MSGNGTEHTRDDCYYILCAIGSVRVDLDPRRRGLMRLEIEVDVEDKVIVELLREALDTCLMMQDTLWMEEDLEYNDRLIDSLVDVINYHSLAEDYIELEEYNG